jgi:hypothetical protein
LVAADPSDEQAVSAAIEELYGGPLDAFTEARNALARSLRELGRRPAADEVKALRKPSLAAWTVNQLVRRHPEAVEALLDAGARLRAAQAQALSGSAPDDFRSLANTRRERVGRLVELAERILAEEGVTSARTHLDRVAATLLAAGEDEAVSEEVRRGRLSEHLTPTGFSGGLAGPVAPKDDDGRRETRERVRRRAEALAAEAEAADREARRLELDAEQALAAAERARRAAARARGRADELRRRAIDVAGDLEP